MHTLTFVLLLISQTIDNSCSGTRLPLEVYELTPAAAAAASATETAAATHHLQQHAAATTTTAADLKHKTLEYTTFDAKELAKNAAAAALSTSSSTNKPPSLTTNADDLTVVSISAEQLEDSLAKGMDVGQEQRRARQMQMHRYDGHDVILPMHLQKQQQQQQQHLLHESETLSVRKRPTHGKDVRILYQVGDTEDDLPICAPNAVCSKIDLYETPWIERQCRCPESNRMPNVIIHHHNHHHQTVGVGSAQDNSNNNNNNNNNNDKYRAYFEKEKLLQHKRLLMGDYAADKKYESLHLKKLMQKLGAVYEDDLQLQTSDYLEQDYNDALPPPASSIEQDFSELSDNEFPHGPPRRTAGSAHMRHSGHRGAKEPISFIGGCPSSLGIEDGHTIADKTRHYKLCQPVHKLPVCKHFRDYTWSLTTSADLNVTEQIVHCRCPKNSVTYLTKREPAGTNGYTYLFACSPLTRIRCQRKQPCKLFTVRKRQEFLDEVNINSLCQCPKGHHCPSHHTQSSVIAGESFLEDNIQTYSGYCMAND